MSTPSSTIDLRQIVARIDVAIRELEALRRQLTAPATAQNLAEELFGALGQGAWDEYDIQLDWVRFGA